MHAVVEQVADPDDDRPDQHVHVRTAAVTLGRKPSSLDYPLPYRVTKPSASLALSRCLCPERAEWRARQLERHLEQRVLVAADDG